MDSREFAFGYSRDPGAERNNNSFEAMASDAMQWSRAFGDLLHDSFMQPALALEEGEITEFFRQYGQWAQQRLVPLTAQLQQARTPEAIRTLQSLNFHHLNQAMLIMWVPALSGQWSVTHPRDRLLLINYAQDLLAFNGFKGYVSREKSAAETNDYFFFSKENSLHRRSFDGVINEYDTAIVLLEAIKNKPNLTVIPGPLQFENNIRRQNEAGDVQSNTNADFLVIDIVKRQVIGVQAKVSVQPEHMRRYDAERIVLIDGKIDLGNTSYRKIRVGSSEMEVSWPGLISAKRLTEIQKTFRKDQPQPLIFDRLHEQDIIKHKMYARTLLKKTRVNIPKTAQIVGDRVIHKLYQ